MTDACHGSYLGLVVGSNIRRERAIVGLSQAQLADRVGTHREIVCRVERGRHAPGLHTIAAYAAVLGCPINRLLIGVDEAVGLRW